MGVYEVTGKWALIATTQNMIPNIWLSDGNDFFDWTAELKEYLIQSQRMYGFCITAFVFVSLNKRSKLNTNAIFCERLFALASQQAFLRGPYYLKQS